MTPIYPGPAYRIVTERLVIRCYNPSDAPLSSASIRESLDHLQPWMPWPSEEGAELQNQINLLRSFRSAFDSGENFTYGIFNADETQLLGGTGLHPRLGPGALEIGYWVHKDFINQGIATETAAALTKVAFEVNEVARVEIHCDSVNVRSAAVPRKLGYTLDATLRQRDQQEDGSFHDEMIWSILKVEYPSSPAASVKLQAFDAMGRCILVSE